MKIAIGQRWKYNDKRYIWIIEVVKLDGSYIGGEAKIVHVIQSPYLNTSSSCYNVGSSVSIPKDPIESFPDYYTYLEGQDATKD